MSSEYKFYNPASALQINNDIILLIYFDFHD